MNNKSKNKIKITFKKVPILYKVLKLFYHIYKKIFFILKCTFYNVYPKKFLYPDVSVIVASYNYEKYIGDTLNSLINQTLRINNIIVIDDGSTDKSVEIIKKYVKKYDNITFIQHKDKKNHGLPETIKYAISFSKNKWIAFCESDDLWDKHHFEYLVRKIKQYREDGIYANKIKLYDDFACEEYMPYLNVCDKILKMRNGQNIFDKMKKSNILPTFSAICVPKNILEKCNFNSCIPQYLDYWLWRQLSNKHNVFYVDKAITLWRKHQNSLDRRDNVSDMRKFLEENDKIIIPS